MTRISKVIQWQTISGDPVTSGGFTVTVQSQALIVRLPCGGFVWNRPVAVLVEHEDQKERIPIRDVTRIIQLGLLGFGLAFAVATFISSSRQRRDSHG